MTLIQKLTEMFSRLFYAGDTGWQLKQIHSLIKKNKEREQWADSNINSHKHILTFICLSPDGRTEQAVDTAMPTIPKGK